ncbi:hypothetical protein D3C84_116490 [compost metagenome]
MRESTISKQAITPSVARSTSATVTPGPARSCLSTKAISPSALGWISEAIGTLEPWSTIMRSVS